MSQKTCLLDQQEDILLVVPVRTVRVQVRFQTVPVCAVPVRALCVGCGRFVRFGSLAVRFVRPGSIRILDSSMYMHVPILSLPGDDGGVHML